MGKKSSPTPDVVGAAKEQGVQSRETARDTTYADRPDQFNAFGSNTWGQEVGIDPATGEKVTKWTQHQDLNPNMQRLLDASMGRDQALANASGLAANQAAQDMSQPLDWGQFGDVQGFDPAANRQAAEDAAYARATQRLDPRFKSQQATLETTLANRGLRAGDQAYDAAMRNFDMGRNDAYEMAQLGAVGEGRQETGLNLQTNARANALRQQQIQEYLGKRNQSLTESNALQGAQNTGNMVQTFGGGQ